MAKAKKSTAPKSGENVSKEELETRRKENEELLRDIEKVRAERLQAQMFIAQTMATPPESEEESNEMKASFDASKTSGADAAEQIKRTLKRQTNEV
jgi:hypothetical protein